MHITPANVIKIIAAVAAAVFFAVAPASPAVSALDEKAYVGPADKCLVPVYVGKSYSVNTGGASYMQGYADDGKMLTDRVYTNPDFEKKDYRGWVIAGCALRFTYTVTIDLGAQTPGLGLFFLRAMKDKELSAAEPESVVFSVSADGKNFTYAGNATTVTDMSEDTVTGVYRVEPPAVHTARYVRAAVTCPAGTKVMLNEVGVCVWSEVLRAIPDESGCFFDSQGVEYTLENGVVSVVGTTGAHMRVAGANPRSDAGFNTDNTEYTLGAGTGNPVRVTADFFDRSRVNWSGVSNDIRYIIIHNTATVEEETTAKRYNDVLHTINEERSWHYTVDEKGIYHSMPDYLVGWHAGSEMNYNTIGIEICVNGAPSYGYNRFYFSGTAYDNWVNTRFRKSMKNAASLTAELLVRYGLGPDRVLQHYDSSHKECPLWMRSTGNGRFVYNGTLWVEFIGYVNDYYEKLTSGESYEYGEASTEIDIPGYVSFADGSVLPVSRIAPGAFDGAGDVLSSLSIPATVNEISPDSFSRCFALESIKVSPLNPLFTAEGGALYEDGELVFETGSLLLEKPDPKKDFRFDIAHIGARYYALINEPAVTVADIAAEYGASGSARSALGDPLAADSVPGTGSYISFGAARLYVIVRGDGNGDGIVGAADYAISKRAFLGTLRAQAGQIKALALTDGETINPVDYAKLKRHVLGTFDIYG